MGRYLSDTRVQQLCDLGILRRDGDVVPENVGVQELLVVLPVYVKADSDVVYRLGMSHTGVGWSAGYYARGYASVLSIQNAPDLVDALYLLALRHWDMTHLMVD